MVSDALEKLEEAALEALARKCLKNLSPDALISDEEVMRQLGITHEDIGNAEEPGMMPFSIVWTKEAWKIFPSLLRLFVLKPKKGIARVAENPLSEIAAERISPDFFKFLKLGTRVVYTLREQEGKMILIVISARAGGKVYRLAAKRRTAL